MTRFDWTPGSEGWFSSVCPDWAVVEAKERHAKNHERFGATDNYMEQAASQDGGDSRWSGILGEIAMDDFLNVRNIPHTWDAEHAQEDPDFDIRGHKYDLKTKNVKSYPKMTNTYFATVPDRQWMKAKEPDSKIIAYLFNSYNYQLNHMYILGAMGVPAFDQLAMYRVPGQVVTPFYTVQKHSWDVLLSSLMVASEWA